MINWQLPPQVNIPAEVHAVVGDDFVAQLLVRRGLTTAAAVRAFLDPVAYRPAHAFDLPDMDAAVSLIEEAIRREESIAVWGDFDVDGQTSTSLLVSVLREAGANVSYYIPNRLKESHGIKIPALKKLLKQGVDLIITCDTGVAEHDPIALAQENGTQVIVTDHHDLPATLPTAEAVINPKRLDVAHPLRELPGVGVAYKVAELLTPEPETLLDLVALGIVADVAHQTGDTRYLLQRGLDYLQETPRLGVQALLENMSLNTDRLTEDHIGYWLAPRMNALGRLGDANLAVELLTTTELDRARILALQLEGFNDRRKLLVEKVVEQALAQIDEAPSLAEYNGLVLAAPEWHPGVLGLAASRLSEQFSRPAILLTQQPDGSARGSARSVEGCDIHAALKTQAKLLTTFGGHPLAAGLTLPADKIHAFRQGLSTALGNCHHDASPMTVDAVLPLAEVSEGLLASIQRLAPFGQGNPPVTLCCTGLEIAKEGAFGKTFAHRRVTVRDESGTEHPVIWWSGAREPLPEGKFDLAFRLSPNDFAGGIQLEWIAAREWEPASVKRPAQLIDWRTLSPDAVRTELSQLDVPLIWAEGVSVPGVETLPRYKLHPAETLVLWTVPPATGIYEQLVRTVKPTQIFIIAESSPVDTFAAVVQRLMGGVKYTLAQKAGRVSRVELAAICGHTEALVQLGLDWLVAQGKLAVDSLDDETLLLQAATQPPTSDAATIEAMLKTQLAETAAYRRFFQQADLAALQQMTPPT